MSKFKVGDRVKSVGGCEPYYKDGDVGTVVGDGLIQFDVVRRGARVWYASDKNLAPVFEATLAVGAKVKVIDEDDDRCGQTGTVESNDGDDVAPWWVDFDNGDRGCFEGHELQVIADEPATATPVRKFKVGDRVKVVKSESWGHDVGVVGSVVIIDSDSGCHVEADGWTYWHPDDEFALADATEPAPSTPASAPAANPLADLLAGFSATPSTGGGITFNLTINLPPGAITELLAAAR